MSSGLSSSPPWRVWIAVMVLALAFLGLAYAALKYGLLTDPMSLGNVEQEWQKERSGKPLVIGVGSSLMLEGIDRRLLREEASSHQFLFFYRPSAVYANFASFFGRPMAGQPRLILVQSDLLLQEAAGYNAFRAALRSAIGGIYRKALGMPPSVMNEKQRCPKVSAGALAQARGRQELARAYQHRPQEEQGLLDWIAQQRAAGAAVVLIDIPRSPRTEGQIGEPLAQWRRDLQALATMGIPALRYTGPLDESDFCDGSHMATEGRKLYTRWLQQNIQQFLHASD